MLLPTIVVHNSAKAARGSKQTELSSSWTLVITALRTVTSVSTGTARGLRMSWKMRLTSCWRLETPCLRRASKASFNVTDVLLHFLLQDSCHLQRRWGSWKLSRRQSICTGMFLATTKRTLSQNLLTCKWLTKGQAYASGRLLQVCWPAQVYKSSPVFSRFESNVYVQGQCSNKGFSSPALLGFRGVANL